MHFKKNIAVYTSVKISVVLIKLFERLFLGTDFHVKGGGYNLWIFGGFFQFSSAKESKPAIYMDLSGYTITNSHIAWRALGYFQSSIRISIIVFTTYIISTMINYNKNKAKLRRFSQEDCYFIPKAQINLSESRNLVCLGPSLLAGVWD